MSKIKRSWIFAAAASATLLCAGCPARTGTTPPEQKPESRATAVKAPKEKETAPPSEKSPARAAATRKAESAPPAPPPTIPPVVLTAELQAGCLVKVGDQLPDVELPDLQGQKRTLHSLFGKKLTVVCFWTIGASQRAKLLSAALLRDLTNNVLKPAGDKEVALVGVDVGDSAAAVKEQLKQAEVSFPNLLDSQGKLLAGVAKDEKTPRIFLLDTNGRILWFDLENSRSSRRNLLQAIEVVLGKKAR